MKCHSRTVEGQVVLQSWATPGVAASISASQIFDWPDWSRNTDVFALTGLLSNLYTYKTSVRRHLIKHEQLAVDSILNIS